MMCRVGKLFEIETQSYFIQVRLQLNKIKEKIKENKIIELKLNI